MQRAMAENSFLNDKIRRKIERCLESYSDKGKPIFIYAEERARKLFWVMPDFETVYMFVPKRGKWIEIPEKDWKAGDKIRAMVALDIAPEECGIKSVNCSSDKNN